MANITTLPPALVVPTSGSWYGNDGSWSTFTLAVGNPQQQFAVLPATNIPNIWVPIADDCRALNISDCGRTRGVSPFLNNDSPGFQNNLSSTWDSIGLFKLGQDDFLGFTGNGAFGYDTVSLIRGDASQTVTNNGTAVTAFASPNFWLGQLGLSNRAMNLGPSDQPSSFLTNLKKNGTIPSLSYGYTAGAPYRSTKIPGSLTLGGYDAGRSTSPLQIPLNDDDDRPLTLAIQSISATNTLTGDLTLSSTPLLAPLDSSITDLWLPTPICETFASALGLQYNALTNRYILSATNHTKLQTQSPTFTFTLGSQLSSGPTITLTIPYPAFDLQASAPIFADALPYFPIRRAANESQYVIGRVFLQEAYLVVDYERNYFNVSQANYTDGEQVQRNVDIRTILPTDLPSSDAPSSPSPSPSSLSPGAIAGIVVGALAGVAVLLGLLWAFYIRPKRAKRFELEGSAGAAGPDAVPHKGEEIMSAEIAELGGGGERQVEMGGGLAMFPVETEGREKVAYELPTPVGELEAPFGGLRREGEGEREGEGVGNGVQEGRL